MLVRTSPENHEYDDSLKAEKCLNVFQFHVDVFMETSNEELILSYDFLNLLVPGFACSCLRAFLPVACLGCVIDDAEESVYSFESGLVL